MTKNKKKLRRAERRSQINHAVQSLVLTGLLLAGGAGIAGAATGAPTDLVPVNGIVDITTSTDVTSAGTEDNGWNLDSKVKEIKISGSGELNVTSGGRIIGWGGDTDKRMTLTMTGGTLTVDASGATSNIFTTIDASKVNISGGTVTLKGTSGNHWESAAYIGGYEGLTISGSDTKVEMGENSMLFIGTSDTAPQTMELSGGTINMKGTGTDANTAHIWVGAGDYITGRQPNTLKLSGADINVAAGNTGIISSKTTEMTAGNLEVAGTLTIQSRVAAKGTTTILNDKATDGTFTLSDAGKILVKSGGTLDMTRVQTTMNGGTLTIGDGTTQALMKVGDFTMNDGTLKVDGNGKTYSALLGKGWEKDTKTATDYGTITLQGGKVELVGGGAISSGHIKIAGSTITAEGTSNSGSWRAGSQIGGMETLTMASGTVTLKDYGMVYGGVASVAENQAQAAVDIQGGTVILAGSDAAKAAILRAHANPVTADSTTAASGDRGKLSITGGTVSVEKFGVLAARETTLSAGSLKVGSSGDLRVVGALSGSNTSNTSLSGGISGATQWGTFTLSDTGTLTVADTGKLDFATGNVDLKLEGGTLNAKALTIDSTAAATGISAQKVAVAKSSYALDTITQKSGSLAVDGNGTLTVKKLDQTSGSITLGGTSAGKLAVNDSLKNVAYASGSSGIEINNLGVLETDYALVMKDGTTKVDDVNKFGIENGGTLRLTGKEGETLTLADANKIKDALFNASGSGMLEVAGATIKTDNADGTVSASGSQGLVIPDATLKDTETTLKNTNLNTGVKNITVSGDASGPLELKSDDLRLMGDADGGQLITATDSAGKQVETNITVNDGKSATLGNTANAAHATKGTLNGSVTLGTSTGESTLNAAKGDFTITGNITTKASGEGTVNVTGSNLNVGAIGTSTSVIGAVNVDSGSKLAASENVYIKDVTLNGGILATTDAAKGDITLTGDVNATGGGIQAANDLNLAGATLGTLNGTTLIAVAGDVNATGKTLTAGENGLTISAEKGTITAVEINGTAGKTGVGGKTLTTTGNVTLNTAGSQLVLTGTGATDKSTIGGTLDLTGSTALVGDLDVAGKASLDGSAMNAKNLTLTAGGDIANGSALQTETLTLASGQTLNVGSDTDTKGSSLVADRVALKGGNLLLDPAWGAAPTQVAIAKFSDTDTATDSVINGNVGVGRNSMLTIGTTDKSWLSEQVARMGGLSEKGIDAALGIYKPQTIASGMGLIVDGTKTTGTGGTGFTFAANTATFSGKSLTVVNAAAASNGNVALTFADTNKGTANIVDGAKLRIVNPKAGQTYTILGNATLQHTTDGTTASTNPTGWFGTNLSTDSRLITLHQNADGTFGGTLISPTSIFPNMSQEMGGLVDSLYADGRNDVNAGNAGVRFVSRATSEDYMPDVDRVAPTLEGAAQAAAVGAVSGMTLAAADAGTGAVSSRTSFASPLLDKTKAVALHMDDDGVNLDSGLSAGEGMNNGLGLWIMPLYQNNNVWGMKSGEFKTGYSGDLGGVALGADYTFQDMFRIGVALNIGGGYAESSGDFNKTNNSFNFWGVSLYGGWALNNFGLTADLGYTGNYNKLEQEIPDSMDMGDLKSDVTSSVLTAGLRGEYKIETSVLDLVPHVGVRYTDLTINSYDIKSGGTVFSVDQSHQSIWTFPIGITASKTIETGSGWQFKPQVDFSIVPAAGDVKTKSNARIPGVGDSAELKTQVVDYMTYQGGIGFDVQKDNLSFGLNYTIQASEHRTGHGVFGTLRYEF